MKKLITMALLLVNVSGLAFAKFPTEATKQVHQAIKDFLLFETDKRDFEQVDRGFIATLEGEDRKIRDESGNVVYDLDRFNFLKGQAPDTVNPSLWRQSKLNAMDGLYEVGDRIYQVRGLDLANMSFIRGRKGWIVVDPLLDPATAQAGYGLLIEHVEDAPITAVIITHSHLDHFGGVKGLIDEEDVKSGKMKLIAPIGFFEESVNENLMAGNQMSRRANYMYGNLLPKSPLGSVGSGLGTTTSEGNPTIIEPNVDIAEKKTMRVDGVKIVFWYTPEAEAPAELMFYIPKSKALCQAEIINHNLHNLYTLRGAQVRNGLKWSKYIHSTIEEFGNEVEISFGSHHWPTWGNAEIVDFWKKQRDIYRYIHDEVLRLANHGSTMLEVAEEIQIPDSLAQVFANRGYYGTVSHNAKSQYQLYFGFFSGNPAELHQLPPVEAGKKYVEYMGGADNVIAKAKVDFAKGNYRWVAQVLNNVVFAEPNNREAKNLLADAYEQMGYQAESGPWRNFYLTGAMELREGIRPPAIAINSASADITTALSLEAYLDFLAVRLNGPNAAKTKITLNMYMPDVKEKYVIYVENGVLNYTIGKHVDNADANVTLNRSTLDAINLGETTLEKAKAAGKIRFKGDGDKFDEFIALLDTFDRWYPIVTP